ncbi:recombinase RecT [Burkholderia anthina]|uniref:recombinase RecT n=1 Tax=Burkholderia anthina TaxID=179879 RepID=UPI0015883889|nr:recombinase RecT [Burkholderia anthina]
MANLAELKNAQPGRGNEITTFAQKADFLRGRITKLVDLTPSAKKIINTAIVQMSQNRNLQECSAMSIYQSISNAVTMGLGIIGGLGYLVPYKGTCTFIPGWQGLVDLVARSGLANVWTGAVFEGDDFDWAMGDRPFVKHKPQGEDDPNKITHVYAIGRVKGTDWPNIEVWTIERVRRHLAKYNKVGQRHYAFDNMEMYARKVVLLQVLKYMPKSAEVQTAIAASDASERGDAYTIDGDGVVIPVDAPADEPQTQRDPDTSHADGAERAADAPDRGTNTGGIDYADEANKIARQMRTAKDRDVLDTVAEGIRSLPIEFQDDLNMQYRSHVAELDADSFTTSRPAARQARMPVQTTMSIE